MAVIDGDKLTHTKSWRKMFASRDGEQAKGSWRPPKQRNPLKDSSQSTFTKIFEKSRRLSKRSFHEARERPKSLSSGHSPSDEQLVKPRAGTVARSLSAPMLSTVRSKSPAREAIDPVRHISIESSRETSESDSNKHLLTSVDLGNINENCSVQQHVPYSEALSKPIQNLPDKSTEKNQQNNDRGDDGENNHGKPLTDSGSIPTQLINLSDGPSEESGKILTKTVLEIQKALKDVYGPTYRRSDDIAGLEILGGNEGENKPLQLNDFFTNLKSMTQDDAAANGAAMRESISTCLDQPSSYSEVIYDAVSRLAEQNWFTRSIVSAWILMSLGTSRLDGLRFAYAVYLMFWIQRIGETSLLMSEVAVLAKQLWFIDDSNSSFTGTSSQNAILRSACRTGLLTGERSTKSSKIAALTSGSERDEEEATSSIRKYAMLDLEVTVPIAMEYKIQHSADEKADSSLAPAKTSSTGPREGKNLEAHEHTDPNLSKQDFPAMKGSNADEEVAKGEDLAHRTIESILEQDPNNKSAVVRQIRPQSPASISKRRSDRQNSLRDGDSQLECMLCRRKFLKQAELANHVDVRHQGYDDVKYGSPPPPYQRRRRDSSSSDGSNLIEEVEKPRDDSSLSVELAKRQGSPLSPSFRIRSAREAPRFFITGRLLAILWHESPSPWSSVEIGSARSLSPNLTTSSYGESVYSHIRRFLVVKVRRGYCWALPISTYGGKGLSKRNVSEDERRRHAIIYDNKQTPQRTPDELPFTKEAIPVELEPGEKLSASSRLHFDKPQSIEWSAKVKNVGMVKGDRDLRNLKLYFQTEMSRGEDEQSIAEDKEGELDVNIASEQDKSSDKQASRPSSAWA